MEFVLKITIFSDESGQDTKGRIFVVCTVVILSSQKEHLERKLRKIEKRTNRHKKWHHISNYFKHKYCQKLLTRNIFENFKIYYSVFYNKKNYPNLVGIHISSAILKHTKSKLYKAKVFVDKTNKRELAKIKTEIKSFKIKYRKIRGLDDRASALIRLADAACGIIRHLKRNKKAKCYQDLFKKMTKV